MDSDYQFTILFIDIFFSVGFSELIGDCPSDLTNPSGPSLLFAEDSAQGAKRMTMLLGILWQLISGNRVPCNYLFYKNLLWYVEVEVILALL